MSTEPSDETERPPETTGRPEAHPGGQAHGRLRSWLLVGLILAAFVVGGIALIAQAWWLFWVCAGIVALGILTGRLIGIMNDTVAWVVPLERSYQPQGHILFRDRDATGRPLDAGGAAEPSQPQGGRT